MEIVKVAEEMTLTRSDNWPHAVSFENPAYNVEAPHLLDPHSTPSISVQFILVLLDGFAIKSSHSLYFKSLQSRGFDLEFKLADEPKIALHRYGQYLYDGLVLLCPTIERTIDLAAIVNFVDSGHDLILAVDTTASNLIREVASECGVDFDEDPLAKPSLPLLSMVNIEK
ncbi:Dolichyl-diphosphooligosaccharide--protein glycosyltransferase 48 kDa subunit [Quillaja saponaria]|uniref:Dolichyl-diphosphooligosaccharide--protein glycosyltransferase 48 kDa subunit n=1 Tax=Quillaja saponaria TaxID=32244 RepID=A0AAD7LI35_QUISA|nr:Dolichyl-diphosphooligosaccharide--protein glycosyltransferase 48 kDa subunit [Quillaja saponaria]